MSVFCQWLCEYVCESEIAGWFYCKRWLEVNVIQSNTFKRPDLAMLSDLLNCSEVSVSDPLSVLLSTGNECEKKCLFASTWTTHTVYEPMGRKSQMWWVYKLNHNELSVISNISHQKHIIWVILFTFIHYFTLCFI